MEKEAEIINALELAIKDGFKIRSTTNGVITWYHNWMLCNKFPYGLTTKELINEFQYDNNKKP